MKAFSTAFKLIGGFAIALAMLLLAGVQMYRSLHEYMETSRWVVHTYQVLDSLAEVRSSLLRLESDQRAYLITGEEAFFAGNQREVEHISSVLAEIAKLTVDNPRQQLHGTQLAQLVEARAISLTKAVSIYHAEGLAGARDFVMSEPSRIAADKLLKSIDVMEGDEQQLLTERTSQAESNANQALLVASILVIGAIFGLLLLWWRVSRESHERQATEAALHASALLKQILDLLPVGIFVADRAGTLIQINPAARAIWNGERHVGVEQFDEYVGWWPDTGKPLAADEWALARTLKSGDIIRDELIDIRCFDGARKTIASHAMPIRDTAGHVVNCLAVHVDVTAFKRTERQLRATARFDETEGRAVALFSASFDRHRIFEGLLALLAELHPFPVSALYAFDEWSGRFHCEVAHGLNKEAQREFALGEGLLGEAAQTGKTSILDCSNLTLQTGLADFMPEQVLMIPVSYKDRHLAALVLATSRPLDDSDKAFLERLSVTLGVALDNLRQYSDLKLLAEQLRASSEEIAIKNVQLEEASGMKSEFLANMSHELRTPLNAIMGFSEILKDGLLGDLSPQQKEYVTDIFTSGSHLLSLINDILDLSKVEAGKMALELEPVQVATLLQAGLQVVREKALAHHLHLVADVAESLTEDGLAEMWLDERKVKQILYNLISNAVKFTPDGGEIHVAARRVGAEAVPGGVFEHYLELTVTDTGIGISSTDQARLFQPFTQIDSTLARRYEGTGLGLAMVKRLTELHGGAVGLQSAPEKGSTFTVWLPWRSDASTVAGSGAAPASEVTHAAALPAKAAAAIHGLPLALVVEDDDKAAELLRVQLESIGFRVAHAATAEAALILATQECPELITLDIMLPGMDGWEFLEQFKQHPLFSEVPVVIVSMLADTNRGMSLGASQVMQKPVGRDQLARALLVLGFPPCTEGERRLVLVVDDDPKAVQLIGTYLEPAGFRVLSAFSGKDGISVARRHHPDLIVLDLMMPELNGFDVVDALQGDLSTATIPVIIVTAKQVTAADRARLTGTVKKVLEKSEFDRSRFIGEVRRAMSRKE